MIRLDAATVLLQWATGGLFFLWITTRRRQLGIGYGWLMRSVYAVLAVGAFVAGRFVQPDTARDACSLATAAAAIVALGVSIVRRKAGVAGDRLRRERKAGRVAAMLGDTADARPSAAVEPKPTDRPEFPPLLDIIAPAIGASTTSSTTVTNDSASAATRSSVS